MMLTEAEKKDLIIANMKAKLQQFKRFKANYQNMRDRMEATAKYEAVIERENRRMLRALQEIAVPSGDFRRKDMIDYAWKVLFGLGLETSIPE